MQNQLIQIDDVCVYETYKELGCPLEVISLPLGCYWQHTHIPLKNCQYDTYMSIDIYVDQIVNADDDDINCTCILPGDVLQD